MEFFIYFRAFEEMHDGFHVLKSIHIASRFLLKKLRYDERKICENANKKEDLK